MTLSYFEALLIVLIVAISTIITRFLPFIIFKANKSKKSYIGYLGTVLPYSAIALLVIYCLKGVNIAGYSHGIPEAIAIICIVVLHYWKSNTLLSIGAGTAIYMLLVQFVFV